QSLQLRLRHPVVQRPLHVPPQLVGAIERREDGHRGQAAVPLAEVGMLPDVAEEDVVAQLAKLGDELVDRRLLLRHVSISVVEVRGGGPTPGALTPSAKHAALLSNVPTRRQAVWFADTRSGSVAASGLHNTHSPPANIGATTISTP